VKAVLLDLKLFAFFLFLSGIIFAFDSYQLLTIPKSLLQTVTVPVQYGLYSWSRAVSTQLYFIRQARLAVQEHKALQTQLGELLSENAEIRRKLAETEAQLDQQNSLSPKTFEMVAARPIGVDRYLRIDKGSSDGIAIGQIVVSKENFIGQVLSVDPHTAEVMLPQDPGSKVAVFSQDPSGKAKGILSGQFGSEILMDKILHQEAINEGDLIYSEGSEGKLPRGLIMGKVTQVIEKPNEVFKQAKVVPLLDLADLDLVYVIR
jgi:rod shape-determining protein MreC